MSLSSPAGSSDGSLPAPAPLDSALFESSPDCVKLVDLDGNIAAMNRNGRCVMQIDDFCTIAGRHWTSLWPTDSHHLVRASIAEAVAGGTGHFAAFCPTAQGTPKWWDVVVSPIYDSAGSMTCLMSVSRDVTAVHQANELLRASREQFSVLLDSSSDGLYGLAADGRCTFINRTGAALLGYRPDQLVGQVLHGLVHGRGRGGEPLAEALCPIMQAVRNGTSVRTDDAEFFTSSGRAIPVTYAVAPMLVDSGLGGAVVTFNDITERKNVEARLREADQRKDEFLAMLAHELRNPLAPIGAAAQLIRSARLSEQAVRDTSDVIVRQVAHMTGLVDDLLDVSRVTRGLVELDRHPLDVMAVIGDAVEQIAPLIDARGHQLTVVPCEEPAIVMGDKKRLVQVVANLLNNAAKYTAGGGNIVLRTGVRGDTIAITVTDNGIGMEPELASRVFDLFTQARRTPDRSSGGLGLGLALVRSLTELHGGAVSCASEGEARGSRFTITLPRIERAAAAPCPAGPALPEAASAALRVMVVDDNQDAADMLAMLLEASGHAVRINYGARQALASAHDQPTDVFLLDIGLPDMDGKELARELRAGAAGANATLIAISGYGQESDRSNALAAGFDHYLVKPVQFASLSSILAGCSARA